MLQFNNVSKSYAESDKKVVCHCDLTIEQGDFLAILGPNGAGKSTLLKLAYGLLIPDEGSVQFDGQSMDVAYEALLPGHPQMEWVDQKMETLPWHTVEENIRQKLRRKDTEEQKERLAFIRSFFVLEEVWSKKAAHLSGGYQQRLALARAISIEPRMLLLDEPFSQLDPRSKNNSFSLLKKINEGLKTSILMVSHQVEEVLLHAKKAAFLQDGEIVQKDDVGAFYDFPKNRAVAEFCGEMSYLDPVEFARLFPFLKLPVMDDGLIGLRPTQLSLFPKPMPHSIKVTVKGKERRLNFQLYEVELSKRFTLLAASSLELELDSVAYLYPAKV